MPFLLRIFLAFGLWLIAEYIAFSLVAQAIGLDGAILVTLATSVAGIIFLRRLGASASRTLASLLQSGELHLFSPERLSAGFSAALGATLLVLPGFLTDLIGLALIARAKAWRLFQIEEPARRTEDVVELSPQDWRRLDEHERR
jgi:UPF0716 protein FxsA